MKRRLLAGVLTVVMAVTMIPGSMMEMAGVKEKAEAAVTLQKPRIVADASMTAGQKVTYDCVWFGSYPQTEIVDKASNCGTYGKAWAQTSDYEENSSLYTSLKNASGWDSNGDLTLNGTKYRRIKSTDATYSYSSDYYYAWNSTDTYHYFRYEPIKWRVLDVTSSQVLLLADKSLDDQKYNTTSAEITWKTSTIRSWLNGYGASTNTNALDFTSKNFINSAFSSEERGAISSTYLDNKTTGQYSESYGGDNTTDKIFLLSSYDMYNTDNSASYGFYKADYKKYDEARRSKSSTYAKAMGVWAFTNTSYLGNCYWWLRSPGSSASDAAYVCDNGSVVDNGYYVYYYGDAARPALNLNLSFSNLYTYAGTVCSDGSMNEIARTYTVSYNANGGSGTPADQTKTTGVDLTLSTTKPSRSGYEFVGWGTGSDSTTATYNAGDTYSTDANITLYAVWKKTLTLSFNTNGGSGSPSSQNGTIYNATTHYTFTLPDTQPSRDGFSFVGWGTSSTATSTYGSGEQISISENTTLYAIWKEESIPLEKVTLTYSNANGGENIPASRTVDKGTSVNLSALTPKKDGYIFVGWSGDKNATSAAYAPGDMVDMNANLTLYAIWEKTITLSYNANGGSGEPAAQSKTIYNTETTSTFTIASNTPTWEDLTFLGWNISKDATNAAYAPGDAIDLSSDLTLYAIWDIEGGTGGDPVNPDPIPADKKTQTITASGKTVPINSAAFSLGAKTSGDGKLTYKSSNTKVTTITSAGKITIKDYGMTNITITAADTSTYKKATKTITITVVPKKMKLKSVKSPKKGQLQIKWAKDKAASGYQIQFSKDWKFNSKKSKVYQKTISSKLVTLKKPVTGLTSKKKYYVRIRALKKVGGKTLQGIWSATKEIKIK